MGKLANLNGLALVEVGADWCGPCRQLLPVLERYSQQTDVPIYQVDADSNPVIVSTYGVMGLPTVLVYLDGELQEKFTGAMTLGKLSTKLEKYNDRDN